MRYAPDCPKTEWLLKRLKDFQSKKPLTDEEVDRVKKRRYYATEIDKYLDSEY